MRKHHNGRFRRLAVLPAVLVMGAVLASVSCQSVPMKPSDGRLPDCPGSPNCVNTQAGDLPSLAFEGPATEAMARLRAIVESMPRATVVEADDAYLHAEFRSAVFRFVDDVQCLLDEQAGVIHVRSASRVGYSDLGVNRRRVEALQAAWIAAAGS